MDDSVYKNVIKNEYFHKYQKVNHKIKHFLICRGNNVFVVDCDNLELGYGCIRIKNYYKNKLVYNNLGEVISCGHKIENVVIFSMDNMKIIEKIDMPEWTLVNYEDALLFLEEKEKKEKSEESYISKGFKKIIDYLKNSGIIDNK